MNTENHHTTPEGRIVRLANGTYLSVLRFDADRDCESWSWHATLAVQGEIPEDPNDQRIADEVGILSALSEAGFPIQPEGSGAPGERFADAPWIQYLGQPCRTLLVSQRGGLDV